MRSVSALSLICCDKLVNARFASNISVANLPTLSKSFCVFILGLLPLPRNGAPIDCHRRHLSLVSFVRDVIQTTMINRRGRPPSLIPNRIPKRHIIVRGNRKRISALLDQTLDLIEDALPRIGQLWLIGAPVDGSRIMTPASKRGVASSARFFTVPIRPNVHGPLYSEARGMSIVQCGKNRWSCSQILRFLEESNRIFSSKAQALPATWDSSHSIRQAA
jgi:hypothetical protein